MTQLLQISSRFQLALAIAFLSVACVDTAPDASSTTGGSGGAGGSAAMRTSLSGEAAEMATDMGIGVNIGNSLENTAVWETGWGQPLITQTYVDGLASHGIKTVRVPVAWDTYAVNGVIQSDKMSRVQQVVQWVLDAGMYAILNIHWDGGWINSQETADEYTLTDEARAKFSSYWTQISAAFSEVGDQLIFEALNEEGVFYIGGSGSNTPDYAPLNELNQTFVDTVRSGGGSNANRMLLISGFATDIGRTCVNDFAIPTDPAGEGKLFLSVHYYDPSTFCILGEPANYYADVWTYPATTWGTDGEQQALESTFDRLASFSLARNIPVIIGELGVALGRGEYVREPASRTLWMTSVASTALSHGMVPVLWDTGSDINRTDGSLYPDFQASMTELGY